MKQELPSNNEMYRALLNRDSSYEGIFFIGVRTTGIFCRPTCTAKKPKKENVEYFSTTHDAVNHGYRPCKVCLPMELPGQIPAWLSELMTSYNTDPSVRLKDRDLKQRGIDPARLRRWFQKHHGMTFHAYMRALRINHAFDRIKHEGNVMTPAFDSGFESLSGFSDAFKKTTGFSPSRSRKERLVAVKRISTPLGPMLAGVVDGGICLLEYTDRKRLEMQVSRLRQSLDAGFITGSHQLLEELERQLEEYFKGNRRHFRIPLKITGTDFQKRAWKYLRGIPYGETRTYLNQATSLGNRNSTRAVARANGDNRLAIIIPCHRVIGSDGKLTGYGGGLWRKKYLLDLERNFNR